MNELSIVKRSPLTYSLSIGQRGWGLSAESVQQVLSALGAFELDVEEIKVGAGVIRQFSGCNQKEACATVHQIFDRAIALSAIKNRVHAGI